MGEYIRIGLTVIGVILALLFILWILGFKIIDNDKVGIVEKWWSRKGSLNEQIISLKG